MVMMTAISMRAADGGRDETRRIACQFEKLAGSMENAVALVSALHEGTDAELCPTERDADLAWVTFPAPAEALQWVELRLVLLNVQDILVRAGSTLPSLLDVRAALVGGQVFGADGQPWALPGVLPMRRDGLTWVDIARETALLAPRMASPAI